MSVGRGLLSAALQRRSVRYWAQASRAAGASPLDLLHRQRSQAKRLRTELDRFILAAEERLLMPGDPGASDHTQSGAEWWWRPSAWCTPLASAGVAAPADGTRLDEEVTIFHDSPLVEFTVRQIRNTASGTRAPLGVQIDTLGFEGSFLSLSVALPGVAMSDLRRDHVIRAGLQMSTEAPVTAYLRLNIRQGPNVHHESREVDIDTQPGQLDFDLFYKEFHETGEKSGWLDVIFERPRMNAITLSDVTLSRFPRAQL